MNPLLSFWIKVQPLSAGFSSHTWKALCQSSAIASSSGDDATVDRTTTTSSWAFDCLNRLSLQICRASSSWLINPMITRMQDAPTLKPSSTAICEGLQRHLTQRGNSAARLNTKHLRKGSGSTSTALLQAQQILQQQDSINYQIQPPVRRRNSKEWVLQYKKERIDKINYNNVFGGMSDSSNNDIPTLPPLRSAVEDRMMPLSECSNSTHNIMDIISPTSSKTDGAVSLRLSNLYENSISGEVVKGPLPNDVICGRGGKANTHPGNVSFREEAKKLRSWYESSSKSEKFTISSFLVDIVRERGGRFLKRNPDHAGRWIEADNSDVRKKASQSLREGRRFQ